MVSDVILTPNITYSAKTNGDKVLSPRSPEHAIHSCRQEAVSLWHLTPWPPAVPLITNVSYCVMHAACTVPTAKHPPRHWHAEVMLRWCLGVGQSCSVLLYYCCAIVILLPLIRHGIFMEFCYSLSNANLKMRSHLDLFQPWSVSQQNQP